MKLLTPKQRDLLSFAIEGVMLVVLLSIVVNVWNKKHATVTTHTVVVPGASQRIAASPNPLPSAQTTQPAGTMETLSVPMDKVATSLKLTMQTPVVWRGVDVRSQQPGGYESFSPNDLAALLRFVPEHPERNASYGPDEPVNKLDVLVTTNWVNVDNGQPQTPANKQAYLKYLESLKTVADISNSKCVAITLDGSACSDAKVRPQVLQTADGGVSGLAYLYMPAQSASYEPSVIIEMAGSAGGRPVYVRGVFRIYDQLYVSANASAGQAQAARAAFAAAPAADTLDLYNRIVTAVKSMRFAK